MNAEKDIKPKPPRGDAAATIMVHTRVRCTNEMDHWR